jgi:aryl-alcohol dehydrogenase-like predicted oxidoreductase
MYASLLGMSGALHLGIFPQPARRTLMKTRLLGTQGLRVSSIGLGIGITAYGVLSRGLISGYWTREHKLQGDVRNRSPRFAPGNLERNLALVSSLRDLADGKGVSVAQLAIAWVASRGEDIVPVIGARRVSQLTESLGALDLLLTEGDIARIEEAVPKNSAAGERYAPQRMAHLDSERRDG